MRVLVTGGSGFVGRALVKELRRRGNAVRILVRDPNRVARTLGFEEVDWVAGNAADAGLVAEAARGVSAIIHLVGIIVEQGANTFERAHVESVRAVIQGARRAGVRRLIHMSALGTRPFAISNYHKSKWRGEELVRASGLDWTIFRPGLIYGSGDGFTTTFARLIAGPWNPMGLVPVACFGDGTLPLAPVSVEDVAHCFAGALTSAASVGRTIDVCGEKDLPLAEVLLAIGRALGRDPQLVAVSPELLPFAIPLAYFKGGRPLVVTLPFEAAYAIAWIAQRTMPKPLLTVDQVRMLQEGNTGDPREAMELFRFLPERFEVGLRRFMKR